MPALKNVVGWNESCGSWDSLILQQPSKNAQQNLNPIYTAPPRFVRSVVNGKLYTVGTGEDAFDIVHVWGR